MKNVLKLFAMMALATCVSIPAVAAKKFPAKGITLICAFSAGGSNDMTSRTVARAMGDVLGVPVTVQNIAGAGGSVGASQAAIAKPDGYTLFMGAAGCVSVMPYTFGVSYNIDSFDVIGQATNLAYALVVSKNFPANTVEEFVDYVKKHPGLNYATPGVKDGQQLTIAQLEQAAGITLTHVPYSGAADINAALIGGHIDAACLLSTDTAANLADGQYKVLAVSSAVRDNVIPSVPTFTEQGYNVTSNCYTTLLAPAGCDANALAVLRDAYAKAMASEYVAASFKKMGYPNGFLDAEASQKVMRDTTAAFKAVIDRLNKQ